MNLLICALLLGSPDIKPAPPMPPRQIEQEIPNDLTGIYEVQGVQIVGDERTPYASIAILKKIPETDKYIVQWTGGVGNNINGMGFVANGKLTLSWRSGELNGVTVYKLGNKQHTGKWFTNKGINVWHEETLIYKMPWPAVETKEPPIGLLNQVGLEVPIKYIVKAEDEDYQVELYKDRVIFRSENWYGFGKLADGKYRVQWTMDDEVVCFSYYERTPTDTLIGAYWYVSEPEVDYEDIYEKR